MPPSNSFKLYPATSFHSATCHTVHHVTCYHLAATVLPWHLVCYGDTIAIMLPSFNVLCLLPHRPLCYLHYCLTLPQLFWDLGTLLSRPRVFSQRWHSTITTISLYYDPPGIPINNFTIWTVATIAMTYWMRFSLTPWIFEHNISQYCEITTLNLKHITKICVGEEIVLNFMALQLCVPTMSNLRNVWLYHI